MTQDKFEALINGQKIPRGRLAEMFDELTETCYEKAKYYREFEGAESALERKCPVNLSFFERIFCHKITSPRSS